MFPSHRVVVTLPGIHATQRLAYLELLNEEREQQGRSPLSRHEQSELWDESVDLIFDPDAILIRPDPARMQLAFQADEVLQEIVSKYRIRFLYALNEQVRDAVKRRGECWRVSPLPRSAAEMRQMVASSRIAIAGREIYYYNRVTGTRFLTWDEFDRLGMLEDAELQKHLVEIADFSARTNPHGSPEIAFFVAGKRFSKADFARYDFRAIAPELLHQAFDDLRAAFHEAVPPELRRDDPNDVVWRNRMCAALIGREEDVVSEETLLGLSPEFYMQIEWLPGGRIEEGELIFDPIFEEPSHSGRSADVFGLCDDKARKFIFNFVREHGDLEYVNIGRVINSLSRRRPQDRGRRDVYIAQIKLRDVEKEIISILRMQKWGMREHLDQGKSLLDAMIESEEYTEYILDRRLGCKQLGMNLPSRVTARKISERYQGAQTGCNGITIWSPYFERDYIHGIATDKTPQHKFQSDRYAFEFARLLGAAAAPNLIVGRCDLAMRVLFDDGDEVIVEDAAGMPRELVVADQTGTFCDYLRDLQAVAQEYAVPVNRRLELVSDREGFARIYLTAFLKRFSNIQREYRKRRRAFDTLFKHRRRDEAGSFAYRWEKVLERLDRADPREIQERIRDSLDVDLVRPPRPHHAAVPAALGP
ncbi:MAG: hypothetical protein HUU20_28770 [Pirellulales bacterium]|nr:hypothetical protein [Pirellulales bacterium]